MNVVDSIITFNRGRDPERLAMKFAKMRLSPFIFLRGTCHLFFRQLPRTGVFQTAPVTWSCGDLHLENFGSYKGDNRLVYFDINDFDEAALAPASWELSRFMVSVHLGFGELGMSVQETRDLNIAFLDGYRAALQLGKARWVERDISEGLIGELLTDLQNRPRARFLDTRTVVQGRHRKLKVDGRKALPVNAAQRSCVERFMETFAATKPNPEFFKVLDIARRIAGTGSLGLDRYVILVEGKGSPDSNYLIDLKFAAPSELAACSPVPQPHWKNEADRVVSIQRRMQAVSMAFLQSMDMDGAAYIFRGLQPSEDRVDLGIHAKDRSKQFSTLMRNMGEVVAWSQLRSSGRQSSAIADELIAFGAESVWTYELLGAVEQAATQVRKDWQVYAQAYDDKVFTTQ